MKCVKVTARLANELTGEPPQLDALLVKALARDQPSAGCHERHAPAPAMELLPLIPIRREWLGPWIVHRVSSPIVPAVQSDRHERIAQQFPRACAGLLAERERGVIATTNGAQKSLWLPLRRRIVDCLVWFAVVNGRPSRLRGVLKNRVTHVGQDRARGNGRVASWTVEEVEEDWSWYATHPEGTVLMRQLPLGDWLPKDLCGYVRDFDAVTPPYWHPGRKTEIVRPC